MKTKSRRWSHEDEWRLIRRLEKADVTFVADGDLVCLFRLPAGCISRIVIGSDMAPVHERLIMTVLATQAELKHVRLFRASLHSTEYKVEIAEEVLPN